MAEREFTHYFGAFIAFSDDQHMKLAVTVNGKTALWDPDPELMERVFADMISLPDQTPAERALMGTVCQMARVALQGIEQQEHVPQ